MFRKSLAALAILLVAACNDSGSANLEGVNSSTTNDGATADGQSDFHVWGSTQIVLGATGLLGAGRLGPGADSTVANDASWASRDPAVASVTGRGAYADVTGNALGATWIVATSGEDVDSLEVSVVEAPPPPPATDSTTAGTGAVATVTVDLWPATVSVGDSVGVFARLYDANGGYLTGRSVSWAVSDETVVGIELQSGDNLVLRAKSPGSATVTATSDGISGAAQVTVQQ